MEYNIHKYVFISIMTLVSRYIRMSARMMLHKGSGAPPGACTKSNTLHL